MATSKKQDKKSKKSGFSAPMIGHTLPKGVKYKHNADGTVDIIYPKKKKK